MMESGQAGGYYNLETLSSQESEWESREQRVHTNRGNPANALQRVSEARRRGNEENNVPE